MAPSRKEKKTINKLKMRKRLYILTIAVLALASCMKNIPDAEGNQPMAFSAVASHTTKGIIATTSYPLDVPFVVESVHIYGDKDGLESASFMKRERISFDSGAGVWRPQIDHFWPETGRILFFAATPDLPDVVIDAENGVQADWKIANEADATVDLCFAETTEDCAVHPVAVPIVFRHALSQVCFKARTTKEYSYSLKENNSIQANSIKVILDSVRLHGFISAGHFTQKPRSWTYDSPEPTADYEVFKSKEGIELITDRYETPVLAVLNTMLFIPQTIPDTATLEEWHHILIRSTVTDTSTGKISSDITYTIPKYSSIPLSQHCRKLEMDQKYTFRLAVGMDDTKIFTAVTDWTETREIIIGDE